jgi:acyl carrier protein
MLMHPKDEIRNFIRNNLAGDLEVFNIGDDDSLIDAGLIDSLGIQKLLAFLESHYKIKIEDYELTPENFESISKISALIETKVLID